MTKQENNKTRWLHVRLSEEDYTIIHKRFSNTTCRKLSEYVRNKLLDKNLTTYYRNKSLDDFMAELMRLRTALNHVGNNFNQAVRKLNSMPQNASSAGWLAAYDRDRKNVIGQVEEINDHLQKFTEQWLQDLRPDHP